jgi:predicted anti-sigma-YlaC factor YlaD
MDCTAVREALSAQLDGEWPSLDRRVVESHCNTCAECDAWHHQARDLHRQMRVAPAAVVPNLTVRIVKALEQTALPRQVRSPALHVARVLLALCAVLQLAGTLPMLFGPIHVDHELGSWDAALSAGLLFAAWRPARAWGMLPLVGAVTLALAVTAVIDVFSGHISIAHEADHLVDVAGLALLWQVARLTHPRIAPAGTATTELHLA